MFKNMLNIDGTSWLLSTYSQFTLLRCVVNYLAVSKSNLFLVIITENYFIFFITRVQHHVQIIHHWSNMNTIFPKAAYTNIINHSTGVILNSCGEVIIDVRLQDIGSEFKHCLWQPLQMPNSGAFLVKGMKKRMPLAPQQRFFH